MKHPLTQELYDYWNGRRGQEAMPERGDIDPAAIRRILADSFVLAAEPGRSPRFRVAGTKVCDLFGRELRGEDFMDLWGQEAAQQMHDFIGLVTGEGIGILAGVTMEAGDGLLSGDGLVCPLELLILPLSHQGRGGRRMLGSLVLLEQPFWLGTRPTQRLDLGVVKFVGADIYAPPQPQRAAWRISVKLDAMTAPDGDTVSL
jgi:hypothetical protein